MPYKVFQPPTEWIPPDTFPTQRLKEAKEIAIDLETRDPNLKTLGPGYIRGDGEIVGISVACEGYAEYFPFAHEAGYNLAKNRVIEFIKEICELPCDKIFHNAMYDVGWLRTEDIKPKGKIIDTLITAPLINENMYWYTLNSLGQEYLQEGKSEAELRQAAEEWGLDPKSRNVAAALGLCGHLCQAGRCLDPETVEPLQDFIGRAEPVEHF